MKDFKYLAFEYNETVYRIVELDQVAGPKMKPRALRPHISVYRSSMIDDIDKVSEKNMEPKFNGVAKALVADIDRIEDEHYYVRCIWDEDGDRAHTLITLRAKYDLGMALIDIDIDMALQRVKESIAACFRVIKEPFKVP